MEILVVLAISSVLIVVIVDVFMISLKSQRQTAQRQKVISNLRYIVETISRQIRTSEINYDYYQGEVGPYHELSLIDSEGALFKIYSDQKQLFFDSEGTIFPALFTSDLEVAKIDFYISPITNPFVEEERCSQDGECQSGSCTITTGGDKVGYCRCDLENQPVNDRCKSKYCEPSDKVCLPINEQPRVTLILGFRSLGKKTEENKYIYLQTTISSRIYQR